MTNPAAPPRAGAGHASLTAAQAGVTAERAVAQLLSGPPAARAEQVAERLLAIQGQDPRGARLAVRVRSQGLSAADVDHALTVDRSLVISWLNRGTLHLVRSADYWPLHRLTTPQLETACARRLDQEGIPPAAADRAAGLIERFLDRDGPLTRAQLAERLESAGVRTQGQALVFLMFLASLRGISVRGPMIGKQHAYVLARDWLGAPPAAPDRDAALAWLARRYLAGHAPATDRDLAKWAGLPLREARRGLAPSRPSWTRARTAWSGWPASRMGAPWPGDRNRRSRRPGCWACSTRCCTAGSPARRCWARTSHRSSGAACSARSPWPAAARSAPGACPAARSR